jgi:hypothetical protein
MADGTYKLIKENSGGTFDEKSVLAEDGKVLGFDSSLNPVMVTPSVGGASVFTDLTDTPASYSGAGGKIVAVNSGASALEFIDAPAGTMSIVDHSTGAFALALTDAGNYLTCNYASGFTVTVPKNSVVAFPIGTIICLEQVGNGAITIAPVDGDVTLVAYDGLTSYGQYAVLTLVKKGTDLWNVIAGTGF